MNSFRLQKTINLIRELLILHERKIIRRPNEMTNSVKVGGGVMMDKVIMTRAINRIKSRDICNLEINMLTKVGIIINLPFLLMGTRSIEK